jgi:predicted AlkP superfamily pyrophosphatase or phosphodiesterase
VEKVLIGTSYPHMKCWKKANIPANLHYGTNPRVPPILCLGDLGWSIVTNATLKKYPVVLHGNHGYDPALPDMAAFFLAHGPARKALRTGLKRLAIIAVARKLLTILNAIVRDKTPWQTA